MMVVQTWKMSCRLQCYPQLGLRPVHYPGRFWGPVWRGWELWFGSRQGLLWCVGAAIPGNTVGGWGGCRRWDSGWLRSSSIACRGARGELPIRAGLCDRYESWWGFSAVVTGAPWAADRDTTRFADGCRHQHANRGARFATRDAANSVDIPYIADRGSTCWSGTGLVQGGTIQRMRCGSRCGTVACCHG